MAKITVAIPTHDMQNKEFFLQRSLSVLEKQSFKDFDVVISDNSEDDSLWKIAKGFDLQLIYVKNDKKGMAVNTNEAISNSNGDLIKILYLDDCLFHENSLERIASEFSESDEWLVTGCIHEDGGILTDAHIPIYNEEIQTGKNTIGSPSVLTIRNHGKDTLLFDENMSWLLDCHYYRQLHDRYGPPKILNEMCTIIGLGKHQMTHILTEEEKLREHNYLNKLYE